MSKGDLLPGDKHLRMLNRVVVGSDTNGYHMLGRSDSVLVRRPFQPCGFKSETDLQCSHRTLLECDLDLESEWAYVVDCSSGSTPASVHRIYSIIDKFPEITNSMAVGQKTGSDERV